MFLDVGLRDCGRETAASDIADLDTMSSPQKECASPDTERGGTNL